MNMTIYDTTLRDGSQGEGISFSVGDKLKIVRKLDESGIHYIEGGYPGSNPKDIEFFKKVNKLKLKHAKITAFGSTRRARVKAKDDANIKALLDAQTEVVTIFGKTWDLHVKDVLRTTLEENLNMIEDSVKVLKSKGRTVIYDAEHFFDGIKANHDYALATIDRASSAGADIIVLCDTNGGTMPYEVEDIVKEVKKHTQTPLGIHTHNDAGVAVANSVVAAKFGCVQVQGTINGYGERCGNADLCEIIPNLKLKVGLNCISDKNLAQLTKLSHYVSELANLIPRNSQPYVGRSAFAHKGGAHVDAVKKNTASFEHIKPELVGNSRRILVSELSGKTNILSKAQEMGINLSKDNPETQHILKTIKDLEYEGYQFEGAEASFELLMKKAVGKHKSFFKLIDFRVSVEKLENGMFSEATVKLEVNGVEKHTAAEGDGPVNALDNALRKALKAFYPTLREVHLVDYKVRVIGGEEGTAAKVRVLVESSDAQDTWETVGVSENIIEASWNALVDSIEYKLLKDEAK
ncbi:MAG: citramalate synthase [bacterium]